VFAVNNLGDINISGTGMSLAVWTHCPKLIVRDTAAVLGQSPQESNMISGGCIW